MIHNNSRILSPLKNKCEGCERGGNGVVFDLRFPAGKEWSELKTLEF